ncbi:MAG: ammonium transporter [Oscillospiraceae bacterium]|jgi:Amt family ammonium transporter|nr:ammonium transporter [Oscillospiraceae bacterium]
MDALQSMIETVSNNIWSIWFLLGAAMVFFMQAGFAAVESGFTRAKNAGNIIMKNLIDFCIGTVTFMVLGFGLLTGESKLAGLIGSPTLDIFSNYDVFDGKNFFFMLVFAATASTIVSGAVAERTKFAAYCVYSAVISGVVYPISAGWVWNITTEDHAGGWLFDLGYIDFAGSSVIHMVGGIAAFIGAALLGPRIGKYVKDKKTGKKTARAIPGHSLTLGALGCFILWFGWYGFNGAAATDVGQLSSILLVTTVAPAVATVATMIFTWVKYGKPDVSMSLNGALAGLVAITAPCANVDAGGAAIIGLVAGILVVVAVEVIDKKLHVDDPVGAIAVHGANGLWGTLAAGLFANPNVLGGSGEPTGVAGLFYGGGFRQLGVQLLGVAAIAAWAAVTMFLVFFALKKTIGLRASKQEEIDGLDIHEHNLPAAYADFLPAVDQSLIGADELADVPVGAKVSERIAVPVVNTAPDGVKITNVTILAKQSKFEDLKIAMEEIGITGVTVTNVMGYGMQKGGDKIYRGAKLESSLTPKIKVEVVVSKVPVDVLVETVKKALYTGQIGDGKIFLYGVENVIKVRTGETGYDALQDNA